MRVIDIKEELLNMQDIKFREFNSKLCPDTNRKMLGIKIPKLREFSKRILKEEDWKKVIETSQEKYFEEIIVKGFLIAYAKIPLEEKLTYIKEFIPEMDSWAMTDTFVPALKIKPKDLDMFWKFILPYTKSNMEFEVRFAIICMLDYFLTEDYIDRVIRILDGISHEGYYVKMAVAWTLAEIGIKFNEKAIQYFKGENHLDKFTYNKALQKMIESYRINLEQKDILRKMKRK